MSLGVDLVPHKTCSLDCVYCECGETTVHVLRRSEVVPTEAIRDELDRFLGASHPADYVTFAGSGEPTLNTALGPLVRHVKDRYPSYKTALLTNSTLLHLEEVRAEAHPIDCVLPSLDAVSEETFRRLNRPVPGLTAQTVVEGLVTFAAEYNGTLLVEVFIVPGINDTPRELALIKGVLERIALDRVQINSLDRPGACDWVRPATAVELVRIAAELAPLPVEIIARTQPPPLPSSDALDLDRRILSVIQRRPSTVEDLSVACRCEIGLMAEALRRLGARGALKTQTVSGREYHASTR